MRMLLLLLLVAAVAAVDLEPVQFADPNPQMRLTYSDPVEILGGTLLFEQQPLYTLPPSAFSQISPTQVELDLENLLPGMYELEVAKADPSTPGGLPGDFIRFEYRLPSAGFTLAIANDGALARSGGEPETWFANASPYDITFLTSERAMCRYSTAGVTDPNRMTAFDESDGTSHSLSAKTWSLVSPLVVWCDAGTEILAPFVIGYLAAPPNFNVIAAPAIVADPVNMVVNLSVESFDIPRPQRVYCEAASSDGPPAEFSKFDSDEAAAYRLRPSVKYRFAQQYAATTNVTFDVTCTNLAGLSRTKSINITVDLSGQPRLERTSPGPFTNDQNPLLGVRVVRGVTPVASNACTILDTGDAMSSQDSIAYIYPLSDLAEGDHEYSLRCVTADEIWVEGAVVFTVDTKPPPNYEMDVPRFVCGDQPLSATLSLPKNRKPDENFAGFRYNVTYAEGDVMLEAGETQALIIDSAIRYETGDLYVWHVWPYDLAGNMAQELRGTTEVIEEGDDRCDVEPPSVKLGIEELADSVRVSVNCTDDGIGCAETFNYSLGSCTYDSVETYGRTISIFEDTRFCYRAYDRNGNIIEGSELVTVSGLPEYEPPAGCSLDNECTSGICEEGVCLPDECANGVRDATESDVDCGGRCAACNPGEGCDLNADCASGFCDLTGMCQGASCTDRVKNGYETDVDCGGPACATCDEDVACVSSIDCSSGFCDNGICASENVVTVGDDDKDGMPDDWEEEHGLDPTRDDSAEDPDEDGRDNYNEYRDGSDPQVFDDAVIGIVQKPKGSFSWFGLVLLVLGICTMGGSGYWLYSENGRKRAAVVRRPPVQRTPQPVTRQAPPKPPPRPATQQLARKRQAERKKVMSAFDDGSSKKEPPKPSQPPKKKSKAFEDLEKLVEKK